MTRTIVIRRTTDVMKVLAGAAAVSLASFDAYGAAQYVEGTTVSAVAVNGGQDTTNPGTTCLKVAAPVASACTASYIGIPNNNRSLIAAALAAKVSGAVVSVYFEDAPPGPLHCPGRVFTSCSLISIEVKLERR